MKSHITIALATLLPFFASAQPFKVRDVETPRIRQEFPSIKHFREDVDTVSLFIIGDVMCHSPQLPYDPYMFFEDIADEMAAADFGIANMEFTLAGKPYTGYPCFSAPDTFAEMMGAIGTDVFLMANNHIYDKGASGLSRTLSIYRSMADSVSFTGAAGSEKEFRNVCPLILRHHGIRLAVVNFTYALNGPRQKGWPNTAYMDRNDLEKTMKTARENSDFVLVMPHWGEEYHLRHSVSQQEWAEWLVEQGADAIVGAHPHVVQDTTHISGVPVIYSVGNAVSNMSKENTRVELAVKLRFIVNRTTGECRVDKPEILPMWCTLPGKLAKGYKTIFIEKWTGRRNAWSDPSDYDNMVASWRRVSSATGIGQ